MPAHSFTLFFKDLDKDSTPFVGGKAANLGEMVKSGFPVPNGFAVSVSAYDLFFKENNLADYIYGTLKSANVNDPQELNNVAKQIQQKIKYAKVPEEVKKEIIKSYAKLSGVLKQSLVAVRSSATAEDAPTTSFAGQQATFLNVKGEANLILKVKECWASLFTPRSIFYRIQNKVAHEQVKIAVVVQKMVQSEVSGIIFTVDPLTNEKDKIIIESVWGLGEMIVQGLVVPDKYVVQKETFFVLYKQIAPQTIQMIKKEGDNKIVKVPLNKSDKQKLSDKEIIKLAKIADKIQKHYYFPQDIEWAKEGKELYVVQTRPITTIKDKQKEANGVNSEKGGDDNAYPILIGSPASPGIGTGKVEIVKDPSEIGKVSLGDVLVAPMTSPDFVPAMRRASAIVTESGGQTSHAAIVSRELGIPCVVGAKDALKILKEGTVITVDGRAGEIYAGDRLKKMKIKEVVETQSRAKTATRIYVNLAEPERSSEIAGENVDGVGLLRAEFMIANIGIHPKEAIKKRAQKEFIDKLAAGISTFCKNFHPKPVVYRATDFKTNEYRSLEGGKQWEPQEPNPMLGYRGAFRYLSDPEVFNLEIQALKKVREKYENLWVMIPFVRSPEELYKVRKVLENEGFFESNTFKFWMMVELPVNVILLEEFIKVGIDGVSVGSNDLTMLLLGTDRDNSEVIRAFDERSPAVRWALKKIIQTCNKHQVTSSICGQAVSVYDEMVEDLVRWGITSVSVNPDSINRVRTLVSQVEKKILNGN